MHGKAAYTLAWMSQATCCCRIVVTQQSAQQPSCCCCLCCALWIFRYCGGLWLLKGRLLRVVPAVCVSSCIYCFRGPLR